MSPYRPATKKSAKHPHHSLDWFRNDDANNAYIDHYKNATITLENTFILEVFMERTWTKLLNPSGDVYECIIKEFFANAFVEDDHISYWVRGKEFTVSRESI